ncbi:MAG: alpha/beta fold hydrolase [Wenzhouxiangellaceae bacterium]
MHYLDEGPREARPVVMVHGNPTWSFYYRNVVTALRGTRRCLVPDHVGMGLSDRPGDDRYRYTLAQRVEDFTGWMDAVAPGQCVDLVVHDWGGAIGLAWAVRHPGRVRRIVILNTWAFTIPDDVRLPRALALARNRLGAWLILNFNAFARMATRMATTARLDRAVARGLVAPYEGAPQRRLATLRFVQDIPLKPDDPAWSVLSATEAGLARLADHPLLIVWGGQDFVFNDRVLERWREVFPEAEVDYLAAAGHYVLEDAAEHVVERIRDFVAD